MKNILTLLMLLFITGLFGQIKTIPQKVLDLNNMKQSFKEFQLFSKNLDASKSAKYIHSATDVTVLNLNSTELNKIIDESPGFISMKVPYSNELISLKLFKTEVLTEGFHASDQDGNQYNYTPGIYYRGIVDGDYNSLVAISVFKDNVMGVISTVENGNIILGKSVDKLDFVSYSDRNLLGTSNFSCGLEELDYNQQIQQQISFDPDFSQKPETNNCVKIYYEIANAPFLMNNSSMSDTMDWITGIQNNIGTLYANDGINVSISSIVVWVIPDPYSGDYNYNLSKFSSDVTQFDGNLAHLVNYPTTTSVAYLDSLCSSYNYAYSGIDINYQQVPAYSWTIMAMTHEMGHALGSPHTHSCSWNGNNTAIDGCGPMAGYSEGCDAPLPTNGGTIMSYCHLIGGVGINFLNGFGPQPAQLIRNTVDSKSCLTTECVTQPTLCIYSIEDLTYSFNQQGGIDISLVDYQSSQWMAAVVPYGSAPSSSDWITYNTPNFSIQGLIDYQYYKLYVSNLCADGSRGGTFELLILPGNFCDGTLFTDTGGSGDGNNYGDQEYFIKTFYPSDINYKVKMSFNFLAIETDWDFLYVHDGDSTNSPLFNGGTLTGFYNPGPVFVSTHPTGAITVVFKSDIMVNLSGWEAVVNCAFLGIEEFGSNEGIVVFPNPTKDLLNLVSENGIIESIVLTDLSGKLLLEKKFNKNSGKINIGHLPKGVYFLKISSGKNEIIKKIIKN